MKQPFKNFHDLHKFRMANCEGCDKWSCFFPCPIWEAFDAATRPRGDLQAVPIPDPVLIDSGYVEGQKIWPCKQFKDYGYLGFVPGVGRKQA